MSMTNQTKTKRMVMLYLLDIKIPEPMFSMIRETVNHFNFSDTTKTTGKQPKKIHYFNSKNKEIFFVKEIKLPFINEISRNVYIKSNYMKLDSKLWTILHNHHKNMDENMVQPGMLCEEVLRQKGIKFNYIQFPTEYYSEVVGWDEEYSTFSS